jgi:PAS domain S-box-containing protein
MPTPSAHLKLVTEQNYKQLFAQAPAPIAIYKGRELTYVFVNDAYASIFNGRELLGKTVRAAFPELDGQGYYEILERVFDSGIPFYANETPALIDVNNDGNVTTRYYNLVYTPFKNDQDIIEGVMAFGNDVTDLVEARLREKEGEQRFRNIVEQSVDPILILKGDNMVLDVANQPLLNLWNVDKSAIGKAFLEILPEMEGQGFLELLTDVYKNGSTHHGYEMPAVFKRPDGKEQTLYFNFVYQPYREADGKVTGVLVLATDVSAQVAAKQKMQETERSFRNMLMLAPVGICILKGEELLIELANDAYLALVGKEESEHTGKHLWDVLPEVKSQGFDQILRNVMQTGETFKGIEYPVSLRRRGAMETIYLDFVYEPLREANGDVERIMVLAFETTDKVMARKKIEESEKELQKRVEERTGELQKKNLELEQYAQVSSHDLQEPLRKIRMYIDMIRVRDYGLLSEFSRSRLDKITEAVQRMSTSLTDLLNFTSLSKEEQLTRVDLNEILTAIRSDLELLIEQKGAVINTQPLPVIRAIPLQMQQLFYNLVNNALKFAKKDLSPVIDITVEKKQGAAIERHANLVKNRWYHQITVKDNGIGFSQEYAEKIFSMFQRLHNKQTYSGTGIGLALCKKVALNHEGDIFAVSADHQGASFYILLPVDE